MHSEATLKALVKAIVKAMKESTGKELITKSVQQWPPDLQKQLWLWLTS
jgi:hypothetical protein